MFVIVSNKKPILVPRACLSSPPSKERGYDASMHPGPCTDSWVNHMNTICQYSLIYRFNSETVLWPNAFLCRWGVKAIKSSLKPEQNLVLKNVVEGKDVLAVLITGFGESLTFQILPDVFRELNKVNNLYVMEKPIILVVTPLKSWSNNAKRCCKAAKTAYIFTKFLRSCWCIHVAVLNIKAIFTLYHLRVLARCGRTCTLFLCWWDGSVIVNCINWPRFALTNYRYYF